MERESRDGSDTTPEVREGMEVVQESPSVCWRMDPEESFSDWTISIQRVGEDGRTKIAGGGATGESSGGVPKTQTYHVHRNILAFGPRGSGYFAGMFRMRSCENHDQTSRIELNAAQADAFPIFLDAIYHGVIYEEKNLLLNTSDISSVKAPKKKGLLDSIEAVNAYGRVVCLSKVHPFKIWSLKSLVEYFCVLKLDIQITTYTTLEHDSDDTVEGFISLFDEFKSIKVQSEEDERLCWWYFNRLSKRISKGISDPLCRSDITTGEIVHSCSRFPELCSENLACLAPLCFSIVQTPSTANSQADIFFETITQSKAMFFLKNLPPHILLDHGIIRLWKERSSSKEGDPNKERSLTCFLASKLLAIAQDCNEYKGLLCGIGAAKHISAFMRKCELLSCLPETVQNLLYLAEYLADYLSFHSPGESHCDFIVDLMPGLTHLLTLPELVSAPVVEEVLDLIFAFHDLPRDDLLYIVSKCDVPSWAKAMIHPDIHQIGQTLDEEPENERGQEDLKPTIAKHQLPALVVKALSEAPNQKYHLDDTSRSSYKRTIPAEETIDREELIQDIRVSPSSVLARFMLSPSARTSVLSLNVLTYICKGGAKESDWVVRLVERIGVSFSNRTSDNKKVEHSLFYLTDAVAKNGTDQQLMTLLAVVPKNQEFGLTSSIYFFAMNFLIEEEYLPTLVSKMGQIMEEFLSLKEQEVNRSEATELRPIAEEAWKHLGHDLHIADYVIHCYHQERDIVKCFTQISAKHGQIIRECLNDDMDY